MCGRYYIDGEIATEIKKISKYMESGTENISQKTDIYPSAKAPVLVGEENIWKAKLLTWGFQGFQKNGVVFNARSETALEKKMFAESVRDRRCVIPTRGFYEWDSQKNKFMFTREDGEILFLAGFYKESRFVILTTEANESLRGIHARMPLILEREELKSWVLEEDKAREILKKVPVLLKKNSNYIQQEFNLERTEV